MSAVYLIVYLLLCAVAIIKAVSNYDNGKIEYDEFIVDEETGFKRLDPLIIEQMKGGIETTGYVHNNNLMIEKYLSPVNPSFNSKSFVEWAKNLIIEARSNGNNPFVDKDLIFPCDFSRISMAYLNLYIRKEGIDILKLYFVAENTDKEYQRFFAVFKRKSSFANKTNGEIKGVSCPYCAGEIFFGDRQVVKCPYCGNTVTMQENDWKLYEIVPVENNVENIGIIVED